MTIGLTGGVATGKSTVKDNLSTLREMDVFDADNCVHLILESNPDVARKIRSLFGPRYLRPNGKPNRSALRNLVFANANARRKLERLLHPLVRSEWQAGLQCCASRGRDYLADIPLLYETDADKFFDAVIVVACSMEIQLARLQDRGIEPQTAQAMLASQLPLGQKMARAKFVVWNDGSQAALRRQIELVANQLFPD